MQQLKNSVKKGHDQQMKIFRLTKKDRELFLDMDPLFMMERLEFPGAFALAAVMEQKKAGEDIPAGLAICLDTGKSIIVQWLCVAMKYRKQGVGEHLLAAVYDVAVQSNYTTVCAYINTQYGRELICTGEETYLRDRLFTETRQLAGEWVTDIRSLQNISILNSMVETEKVRVMPLRALLPGERCEALQLLADRKYAASLYPVEDKLKYLDLDTSVLLYDGDVLSGGLLIQSMERINTRIEENEVRNYTENVLYPVYMCVESAIGVKVLLTAALKAAGEKYAADSEVHILMNEGHYAPVMERILPDSRIESKMFIASVENYLKQDAESQMQIPLSIG